MFKNQTFIANGEINVGLKSDYFAFQLSQNGLNSIEEVQRKTNKTYIVPMGQFLYQDKTGKKTWDLKTIKCQNPSLAGFYCLDFSNVPSNYTIKIDNSQNIYSYLKVSIYKCQDTDFRKTFVPDNCADLNEINSYINNPYTLLKVQIQISQFNTTTKKIESCYRNQNILISTTNIAVSELKLQDQSTTVKQGAILQSSQTFHSPISYTVNTQIFDQPTVKNIIGLNYFTQFRIDLDEFQQYTSIQYPTLPQILAQCNSAFTLLMCFGIIGRYLAQRLIRQDLFILVLKNLFIENFMQILGQENDQLIDDKLENKSNLEQSQNLNDEYLEEHILGSVFIPSFKSKQTESSMSKFKRQKNNSKDENKVDTKIQISQTKANSLINEDKFKDNSSISCPNSKKKTSPQRLNLKTQISQHSKQKSLKINEEDFFQSCTEEFNKTYLQKNNSFFSAEMKFDRFQFQKDESNIQKNKNVISRKINRLVSGTDTCTAEKKVFKFKFLKKEDYLESLGLEKQVFQFIEQQVDEIVDFSKIIEELTFLKKAVMIMLNKDQLAALKFVGCSKNLIKYINKKDNQYNKLSYFEEQFAISLSIEEQSQLFNEFITKCKTQNNLSAIDKRIYSSIL